MKAKKSLGQNFLMHARTAERIAESAEITNKDTVLEIGPGTGMLTAPLLARAKKVIAVEADRELADELRARFQNEIARGKLELIEGDIREFDPNTIRSSYALVANIPYYITGELLRTFLSGKKKPTSITFLVQKEVAERIVGESERSRGSRSKKESLLSIAVKAYGEPRYMFTIPRGAFIPAPKVDSAVLRIAHIRSPFSSSKAQTRFFEIVRAGFAHKRKLLARNLEVVAGEEAIEKAFLATGLPAKARAEDVPLSGWISLAERLPG